MALKMQFKKFLTRALMATLILSAFSPASKVLAAGNDTIVKGTVRADGVRLRKEGHDQGTILELMYKGESVDLFLDRMGTDPEYNYARRIKTGTCGYVDHNFISY